MSADDLAAVREARKWIPNGFWDDDGVWHDGPHRIAFDAALDRLAARLQALCSAAHNEAERSTLFRHRFEKAEGDWAIEHDRAEATEAALQAELNERMTRESGRALIEDANRWASAYKRERDNVTALREALEEIALQTFFRRFDRPPQAIARAALAEASKKGGET